MNTSDINNHFGDMDLFLMDMILKGYVPNDANILDIGCGEGRNGVYFIKEGYSYHGVDQDESKLRLIEYLAGNFANSNARFTPQKIQKFESNEQYDFLICSRVLHFADDMKDFMQMWEVIKDSTASSGFVYICMDSAIENTLTKESGSDLVEFPDGSIRFVLTENLYQEMKKGFEEVEPLRTLIHHQAHAQSLMLLRKC